MTVLTCLATLVASPVAAMAARPTVDLVTRLPVVGPWRAHLRSVDPDERLTLREFRAHNAGGQLPDRVKPGAVLAVKAGRVMARAQDLSFVAGYHDRSMIDVPPTTLSLSRGVDDLRAYARRHGLSVPKGPRGAVARVLPTAEAKFPREVLVAPIDMPSGFQAAMAGRSRLLLNLSQFARGN